MEQEEESCLRGLPLEHTAFLWLWSIWKLQHPDAMIIINHPKDAPNYF